MQKKQLKETNTNKLNKRKQKETETILTCVMPVLRVSRKTMPTIIRTRFSVLSVYVRFFRLGHRTRIVSVTFCLKLLLLADDPISCNTGRHCSGFSRLYSAQNVRTVSATSRAIVGRTRSFLPKVIKLDKFRSFSFRKKFCPDLEKVFPVGPETFDKVFDVVLRPEDPHDVCTGRIRTLEQHLKRLSGVVLTFVQNGQRVGGDAVARRGRETVFRRPTVAHRGESGHGAGGAKEHQLEFKIVIIKT